MLIVSWLIYGLYDSIMKFYLALDEIDHLVMYRLCYSATVLVLAYIAEVVLDKFANASTIIVILKV